LSLNKKASVTITFSQSPAEIVIDGQTISNASSPLTISLSKGTHQIEVSKEGFNSSRYTLEIKTTSQKYSLEMELGEQPKIEKIIDSNSIAFPALNTNLGTVLYFEKTENGEYTLKEFDPESKKTITIIENSGNVSKVSWSPSFRQAAIKVENSEKTTSTSLPFIKDYGEGAKVNWIVNVDRKDLVNIETKSLNPVIKNIAFNPEGNKIVYYFDNGNIRSLSVANPDGSAYTPLVQLETITFEPDVLWSPDGNTVAIFPNTKETDQNKAKELDVFVYNFEKRQAIKISSDNVSTNAKFSPDGSYIIYQSSNAIIAYNLKNSDPETATIELGLNASLDNCAWIDSKNLIAINSEGRLVKLNIDANPGEKITELSIAGNEIPSGIKNIFFKNQKIFMFSTGAVYSLDLGKNI